MIGVYGLSDQKNASVSFSVAYPQLYDRKQGCQDWQEMTVWQTFFTAYPISSHTVYKKTFRIVDKYKQQYVQNHYVASGLV